MRSKAKIVTGFCPIPGQPRDADTYHKLAANFDNVRAAQSRFVDSVEDCWLWKFCEGLPKLPQHATHDNPAKNSLAYLCVTHQKFEWLVRAAILDSDYEVFVWVDYGIFHLTDIQPRHIEGLLDRVVTDGVAIPGCWNQQQAHPRKGDNTQPSWRFCGGVYVVPRRDILPLYAAVRHVAERHIARKGFVTWEMNTLAEIEERNVYPVHWYQADHDASMFTGY